MRHKISEVDLEILRKLFVLDASQVSVNDLDSRFEVNDLKPTGLRLKLGLRSLITSGYPPIPNPKMNYHTVIQFGSSRGYSLAFKQEFRYIRVNGSIRWVFLNGNLNSIFDFYHASTKRSKLLKFGLQIIARLRLDRLVSKKLTIHSKSENIIEQCTSDIPFEKFSVFMGTPGVERTVLISLLTQKKSTHFLKIGLNTISQTNVGNEGNILYQLNRKSFNNLKIPIVRSTMHRGVISLSKLESPNKTASNSFVKIHAKALAELADVSQSTERFHASSFGDCIIDNLNIIRSSEKPETPLKKLLIDSIDRISSDFHFRAGLAHGDFTPWNMFLGKDKLFLYDWEASKSAAPALFDFFHYHFQAGIFLKKWSFNKIYTQIKFSIESNQSIQDEINNNSIDIKVYLQLYLIYTVSRKLVLMEVSNSNETLLDSQRMTWLEAMIYTQPESADNRVAFISEFDLFLSDVHHAFLKFDAESLKLLPISSDLDIAIDKKSLKDTIEFCKAHRYVNRCKLNQKSFMTTLELFFNDGRFLSIDLIVDFRRKWVKFMNIKELLYFSNRKKLGFYVPSLEHDIEYTLMFYILNGAKVPEKYIDLFTNTLRENQLLALRYFQKKYDLEFSSIRDLLSSFDECKDALKRHLNKRTKFSPLSGAKSRLNYISDTIKDRVGRKGFVLTVSGVDGVGKTTVIELVKEQLQRKYRKEVVLMRHRPKVLPILSTFKYGSVSKAENRSTHLDPSSVSKKSGLASYMRFSYYYLDYLIGQFYIHARYVWGGKIVLYDRYYFDLINHPQRTNLVVNRKFAKYLYGPILKPSLNVFLSASPDQIVKRKQELNFQQIKRLTDEYLSLFRELSRKDTSARYVVHRNDNLAKTVFEILQDVQQIA